jgi:hypothetical protein
MKAKPIIPALLVEKEIINIPGTIQSSGNLHTQNGNKSNLKEIQKDLYKM